jgi:hypothetical protein
MKTVGMMNLRKMKVPLRKLHHQQTHRSSQYAKRKNLRKMNHKKRVLSPSVEEERENTTKYINTRKGVRAYGLVRRT